MTWSYDPEMGTARDEVRFLVGDTDPADPQLENEEVAYLLTRAGADPAEASVAAASALAARYSRLVTKAVGDLKIQLSDRTKQYRELARYLATTGGGAASRPLPVLTGRTYTQKDEAEDDTDGVPTAIRRGMDDHDDDRSDDGARGGGGLP